MPFPAEDAFPIRHRAPKAQRPFGIETSDGVKASILPD
jgi:hypothetical protein